MTWGSRRVILFQGVGANALEWLIKQMIRQLYQEESLPKWPPNISEIKFGNQLTLIYFKVLLLMHLNEW